MTNFPDILDLYSPARISKHVEDYPDELLHGTARTPWPELQGMVGIFFTSRSGSTALARLAERHFTVERVGETLNAPTLQRVVGRRSLDSMQAALKWNIRTGSPAGWYLFKSGGAGLLNAARIGFLDQYGAAIRPIFLLRQDLVGQALSIFLARNSGQFHSTRPGDRAVTDADFDRRRIETHMAAICNGNARLERIIGHFSWPPRLLLYESYRDGNHAAPLAALAATGLPARASPRAEDARAVVRNTHPLTARFRERFMEGLSPRASEMIARHAELIAAWQARGA